jgi:hypothetical protein
MAEWCAVEVESMEFVVFDRAQLLISIWCNHSGSSA